LARALLCARTRRHPSSTSIDETLAPQWVTLLGASYAFRNEAAVALSASYTFEGDAIINGATSPGSRKAVAVVSVSGAYPLSDRLSSARELLFEPSSLRLRSQPDGHDWPHFHVHLVLVVTRTLRLAFLLTVIATSIACQRPSAVHAPVPRLVLSGTDGRPHDLSDEARSARFTVLFFSAWVVRARAFTTHAFASLVPATALEASTSSPSTPSSAVRLRETLWKPSGAAMPFPVPSIRGAFLHGLSGRSTRPSPSSWTPPGPSAITADSTRIASNFTTTRARS